MRNNKKALSAIVTTLIIILLVLVAVGIIWVVINRVVQQSTTTLDYSAKCFEVEVKVASLTCTDGNSCSVVLTRGSKGEDIDGVKLVFSNADEFSDVISVQGNIEPLATVTEPFTTIGLTALPTSVEVTPYFLDDKGEARNCNTVTYP